MASDSAATVAAERTVSVVRVADYWRATFRAMASPCELLIEGLSVADARHVAQIVANCAWRIERHFSRYRSDNIIARINSSAGEAVNVDEETARLLDFAQTLHALSDGMFDITSGVLREVWKFDGSDRVPTPAQVARLLPRIGWDRVQWDGSSLRMQPGMEVDFGGIGKEYAVDQALAAVSAFCDQSALVNFGGDLAVSRPRDGGRAWRTGVEKSLPAADSHSIDLHRGALATSGDARRFLIKDGQRYSHVLDPRSGWPVKGAPHSVTVAADTCTQAGMLATLGLLGGEQCEAFLDEQEARYWVQR